MSESSQFQTSWKYWLIICGCIIVVYSQSLNFDFVNYDDPELIYDNQSYIGNVANVFNSFATHAFTTKRNESVYYRPILIISYIIDYQIWKLNPAGYHLTNILLHCLTAIIIFLLFQSILNDKLLSTIGSLLFSLHPIQVESVAWIAGRNDILLGLFVTLMLYFYILHSNAHEKSKFYLRLSVVAFTVALLTKESAAFFLLLIPAYDLTMEKNELRTFFARPSLKKYLPFIFILLIYLLIRLSIFGEVIGAERLYGKLSLVGRLQLVPALISEHLSLLLVPFKLCIEHPLDKLIWLESPWNILAIIITIMFLSAIGLAWKKNRVVSFGLLWLFIGLIPTLNIFPVAVPILEHRLYTVMPGFVLLLILFISLNSKKIIFTISVLLILLLGSLSFLRLPVWKNSEALWLDAIEKAPTANRSYFNLAGYYFEHQRYDKTIELLQTYIKLKPEDFLGYSKLRQTYYVTKQYDKAIEVCREMISMDPKNQNRYLDLGLLFDNFNLPDSVINLYQEALQIDSTFYQIHDHLGTVYQKLNNLQQAEYHYKEAIKLKPEYAMAYFHMASISATEGKYSEALQWIDEGIKHGPPPQDVLKLREYLVTHPK